MDAPVVHDPDFVEGKCVVIIDDEVDVLSSMATLLTETMKVEAVVFPSGEAALEGMDDLDPDLIISDYRMPGLNGNDVLALMAEQFPGVPRVLMSAYTDLKVAIEAVNQTGVAAIFNKPFDLDEVVSKVNDLLVERHMQE